MKRCLPLKTRIPSTEDPVLPISRPELINREAGNPLSCRFKIQDVLGEVLRLDLVKNETVITAVLKILIEVYA